MFLNFPPTLFVCVTLAYCVVESRPGTKQPSFQKRVSEHACTSIILDSNKDEKLDQLHVILWFFEVLKNDAGACVFQNSFLK